MAVAKKWKMAENYRTENGKNVRQEKPFRLTPFGVQNFLYLQNFLTFVRVCPLVRVHSYSDVYEHVRVRLLVCPANARKDYRF